MNRFMKIFDRIFRHTEPKLLSEFMIAFGNFRLATEIILDCVDNKISELNKILNLVHTSIENTFSGNVEAILNELTKLESNIFIKEK